MFFILHASSSGNPHTRCRQKNPEICQWGYPQSYCDSTIKGDHDVTHRRRSPSNGGMTQTISTRSGQTVIDNSVITEHNPALLLKYNCHIHVKTCPSPLMYKYLYKYPHKGKDRAVAGTTSSTENNEVQDFKDFLSTGPIEAMHQIFKIRLFKVSANLNKRMPVRFHTHSNF